MPCKTCIYVCLWCREAMMTRSLRRLKEQIVRANLLAQEASFISEELNKRTEYLVTLQIPAANLDANRKVGTVFMSGRRKKKTFNFDVLNTGCLLCL